MNENEEKILDDIKNEFIKELDEKIFKIIQTMDGVKKNMEEKENLKEILRIKIKTMLLLKVLMTTRKELQEIDIWNEIFI